MEPGSRFFIGFHDAALGSHFGSHIAENHPAGYTHLFDHRPCELHRPIISPVGTQISDCEQDEIFGINPVRQLTLEADPIAVRHHQPDLACGHYSSRLRTTDAGGKSAKCAVCSGVRIAAHDQVTRQGMALLRQNLMADALAHVIEVLDSLLLHELTNLLMVLRMAFRRRRDHVIQDDDVDFWPGNLLDPYLTEYLGDSSRVIVGQQLVRPNGHYLTRLQPLQSGFPGKDLLRKSLPHGSLPGLHLLSQIIEQPPGGHYVLLQAR